MSAKEGVYTQKLQRALYARGKQIIAAEGGDQTAATAEENCIGEMNVESLIHENEVLKGYQDAIFGALAGENGIDAQGVTNTTGKDTPRGIHVDILLLEPDIRQEDAVVIPPPPELNKMASNYRPYSNTTTTTTNNNEGSLYERVYTSSQFTTRTSYWEQVNIQAFTLVALDIRKALVRVEFPEFDEGFKEKTFREVYQLNAKVSPLYICVFVHGYTLVVFT